MKFNNKELMDLSLGEGTIEGRLHHRKIGGGYSHSVFKERWFKLRANILFYFNLSETGQIFDKKPVGAYILENVIVQYEMSSEVPFSFSLHFNDEFEKKHLFSGRNQENINKWVAALKQASYEYWRSQLLLLQEKIRLLTGQDPLLMYPRNAGCKPVFSSENDEEMEGKIKSSNSTFQSYINSDNKKNNLFGNGVKSDSSSPPIRPARGNKPKPEVQCKNLIDL